MPRTKKTTEQKIATLEGRVKALSGAVLTLEGWTKELRSSAEENTTLKKQVEQLTKDLNLARGTIRDKRARIEDLEGRLASKTESYDALSDRYLDSERLQKEITRLTAELGEQKEKEVHLYVLLNQRNALIAAHEDRLKKLLGITQTLDDQNTALRKALKAVL